MASIQELVYNLEEGGLRRLLVQLALVLLTVGIVSWIGISEFNGLKTQEAMDLAQQARQIATGQGLTTQLIRPLALWQLRAQFGNDAPEPVRSTAWAGVEATNPKTSATAADFASIETFINFPLK